MDEEIPGSEDLWEWWELQVKHGFYFSEGVARCYVNGKEVYPVNGYYYTGVEDDEGASQQAGEQP